MSKEKTVHWIVQAKTLGDNPVTGKPWRGVYCTRCKSHGSGGPGFLHFLAQHKRCENPKAIHRYTPMETGHRFDYENLALVDIEELDKLEAEAERLSALSTKGNAMKRHIENILNSVCAFFTGLPFEVWWSLREDSTGKVTKKGE